MIENENFGEIDVCMSSLVSPWSGTEASLNQTSELLD